jgi:hypothetical protein
MGPVEKLSRRLLLRRIAMTSALVPVLARMPAAHAQEAPLISVDDPIAKAVKYVEDASQAKGAMPGSTCANCALYQGKAGAPNGGCQIFPGKSVVAAGWCTSWAPQI